MVPPRDLPSQHVRAKSASTLLTTRSNNRNPIPSDTKGGGIYRETDVRIENVPLLPADHAQTDLENMDPTHRQRDCKPGLHRRSKSAVSLRSLVNGDAKKQRTKREPSPSKKQKKDKAVTKTKSSTGLANMFSKLNKSNKNLAIATDESHSRDGDATTPHTRSPSPKVRPDASLRQLQHIRTESDRYTPSDYSPSKQRNFQDQRIGRDKSPTKATRPRSLIMTATRELGDILSRQGHSAADAADRSQLSSRGSDSSCTSRDTASRFSKEFFRQTPSEHRKTSSSSSEQVSPSKAKLDNPKRQSRVMAAVAAIDGKDRQAINRRSHPPPARLTPREVEEAFEAVLETRNIPTDQRQKMRTLTVHVKADFVRQDQAIRSQTQDRSALVAVDEHKDIKKMAMTTPKRASFEEKAPPTSEKAQSKRSRPRSKTFTFSKTDTSPSKKQRAGLARPVSVNNSEALQKGLYGLLSSSSVSLSKQTQASTILPNEFVLYLRTTRDPVETEVGRLHKLRLLLRNETVKWVDEFVRLGGMDEVADLLHRIIAMEWREDHEDQLLHETLLCLKGLCTTEVALQKLDELADGLLPSLVNLVFGEDRKGPSEFTTRSIVFSIMFAYLGARLGSTAAALEARAHRILRYLEGPSKERDAQAVSFVLDMRVRRPYRIWCKEVTNVLKEVFWIFLHHGNVVALPDNPSASGDQLGATPTTSMSTVNNADPQAYTERHFPRTRAPTPAAPYIGGVEWDATTYVATHLDLINALVASLPDARSRNELRTDLQASGFEKIMGSTLRTCKEKFYACVHDGLRVWVSAAEEDGWETEFVRCGPSVEQRAECAIRALNSPKRKAGVDGEEEFKAPQLGHVPKLDLGFDL